MPERPRVTIGAICWFVLVVALVNWLFVLGRSRLDSGLPPESGYRAELLEIAFYNAIALVLCLGFFYAPWLTGKTRREFVKHQARVWLLILVGWPLAWAFKALAYKSPKSWLATAIILAYLAGYQVLLLVFVVRDLPIRPVGRADKSDGRDAKTMEEPGG
jgi:hypothetical protein